MTPHDLLANFETLAEAPNGIERLRELVLELAVRGKLVEQDPGDESASAYVKQIAAEKMPLVKQGRLRNHKTSQAGLDAEVPFPIPSSWIWVRAEDAFLVVTDGDHQPPPKAEIGIPFLVIGNVSAGKIDFAGSRFVPQSYFDDLDWTKQPVSQDILYTVTGSYGIVVEVGTTRPFCVQRHIAILKTPACAFAPFLALALKSPNAYAFATSVATGTAQKTVPLSGLRRMPIPVPPLAEQRRIVARVDELMALLDRLEAKRQEREAARTAARDSALAALREAPTPDEVETAWLRIQERFHELFATPEDVEPLRLAILQLAVAGRLVPQNANDTSAVVALRKIEECRRQWIKTGKMRAGKPNPAISDAEIPFQIPEGWALARLGDVLANIQPGWSPQCEGRPRVGAEWGVLKVSACSWGRFLPEENKALPAGMEVPPDIEVQPGDWIISRANTTELVGRSVLAVECPPHLLLSDKTLRLVPMTGFSPRWGNLVNHAPSSRAHYAAKAGGTSASMRNISQEVIRNLVIAIPPIEEQDRIYAKFETLMAILDRLVGTLDSERNLSSTFAAAAVHHLEA